MNFQTVNPKPWKHVHGLPGSAFQSSCNRMSCFFANLSFVFSSQKSSSIKIKTRSRACMGVLKFGPHPRPWCFPPLDDDRHILLPSCTPSVHPPGLNVMPLASSSLYSGLSLAAAATPFSPSISCFGGSSSTSSSD